VPLLAAVMSIGGNERHTPLRLAPPDLRRRVLQLLIEQIKFIAAERPLLIVFEDLQWSDPTSL
jgi:predicted ATPase